MDLPIPDFGDLVGLRRALQGRVERTRRMQISEGEKRIWTAELTRQYRKATEDEP